MTDRPFRQSRWQLWAATASATVLLAAGCGGRTRLWLVPVEPEKINPRRPLVSRFDLPAAYFWTNERHELCIALSRGRASGRRTFDLSLVLDGAPAGYGRKYRVDRRTLRAVVRRNGPPRRYASYHGIASVWLEEDDRNVLSGRFKIWANEQEYRLWMDSWTGNHEVLWLGEFRAIRDRAKGEAILQRTEVEELKRGPPLGRPRPVTGPPLTTQPAG